MVQARSFALMPQGQGKPLALVNNINVIGSDPEGRLYLDDLDVLRHSFIITRRGVSFFIESIGKAQVLVNREPLQTARQLIPGDVVTVQGGGTGVFLETAEDPASTATYLRNLAADLQADKLPPNVNPLDLLSQLADCLRLTDEAAMDIAANTDIPEIDGTFE